MILDLILFRPEFFMLFCFFVLLWQGTGNLVSPVAEVLTVTNQNTPKVRGIHFTPSNKDRVNNENSYSTGSRSRGPNHAVSALTQWAVTWSILCFQLAITSPLHLVFQGGSFQKDAYSLQQCRILFLTRAFVQGVSYGWQKIARICQTEYIYQAQQALIGQYLLIMSTDLMSLYLCMELQSFSLVVLCGLNSKSAYSLEAAMKYFQQSAFRSCLLLQGIGFIYWQTGETSQPHIEKIILATSNNPSLLTALGIWLISMGQLWKQAVAPQHFWVPDVYMGAWSSVSQWITVQPKIAVLAFWTHHWHRIWNMSYPFSNGNALILFRAFSMIVGRIRPLAQTNIKRLLAYSSIGHMGVILMPLCASGNLVYASRPNPYPNGVGVGDRARNRLSYPRDSMGVLWAYMIIYIIINRGVWGMQFWPIYRPVSLFVRTNSRGTNTKATDNLRLQTSSATSRNPNSLSIGAAPQYLWDLKGQNSSSARAAFRWAVFMTSLAGLPPVYSFQGKAAVIWHAVNSGLFILVAVALRYTMIGSVYYQKVMKIAYVDNPTSWRSYGKVSPITAYVIRLSVFIMLIGQWHGNSLFQYTHLLALKVSIYFLLVTRRDMFAKYPLGPTIIVLNDFRSVFVYLCCIVLYGRHWHLLEPS